MGSADHDCGDVAGKRFVAGDLQFEISGLTDKPIKYFVTRPLSELVEKYKNPPSDSKLHALENEHHVSLFLSRACVSRTSLASASAQQRRFCSLINGRLSVASIRDIKLLAKDISHRNIEFRQEISFAGAVFPSDARIVYAPHALVEDLMKDYEEVVQSPAQDIDCVCYAALVGYYVASVHPFMDGNGRISRLAAAHAGLIAGSPLRTMINISFQNSCKTLIVDRLWSDLSTKGLEDYLSHASIYEDALLHQLESNSFLSIVDAAAYEIRRSVKNRSDIWRFLEKLSVDERVSLDEARGILGFSMRAISGLVDRLKATRFIEECSDEIRVTRLCHVLERAVEEARKTTFNEA